MGFHCVGWGACVVGWASVVWGGGLVVEWAFVRFGLMGFRGVGWGLGWVGWAFVGWVRRGWLLGGRGGTGCGDEGRDRL
jgi:hypothetical protein